MSIDNILTSLLYVAGALVLTLPAMILLTVNYF